MIRKHISQHLLCNIASVIQQSVKLNGKQKIKNISFSKINAIALYTSSIIGAHAL